MNWEWIIIFLFKILLIEILISFFIIFLIIIQLIVKKTKLIENNRRTYDEYLKSIIAGIFGGLIIVAADLPLKSFTENGFFNITYLIDVTIFAMVMIILTIIGFVSYSNFKNKSH